MTVNRKVPWRRRAALVAGQSFSLGSRSGLQTLRILLVVMVPVMLVMMALEVSGLLPKIAWCFAPAMRLVGLPGDTALAFISGALVNLYSAVAVSANLSLTVKEITVLALLCLICHNLLVECAVQRQAGTGFVMMLVARLTTGFAAALVAAWLIPSDGAWAKLATVAKPAKTLTAWELLAERAQANGILIAEVVVIVMALMILVEFLRQTGALKLITTLMRPLTWLAGLSPEAGFTVVTAMTLGLAYGAGTVIAEARRGQLSRSEQFRTNIFIGTTHSLVEDTMLFFVLHASLLWIVLCRLVVGCVVVRVFSAARWVWLRRFPENNGAAETESRRPMQ